MKIVQYPLSAPEGQYCRIFSDKNSEICPQYDNEGGHNTCNMGYFINKENQEGVLKDPECLSLDNA